MKKLKPQFLIIGLVAIITIISLIYFIFLKYSPIMNFKYEGYAVSGKKITEKLLGAYSDKEKGNTQNVDSSDNDVKNIDLAKIEEQGTIFKKLGQYFIGSKEKTEIDLNYPIYINDKNTIYNLSQDITLISKDFEKVAGYPNISLTDGKVYNGNSLERSDSKEYIFARTNEGIYINLKEIKIITTTNEYVLPANSLIAFEENEIRYYTHQNNTLIFNEIKDIDYNSQVVIKNIEDTQLVEKQCSYEELLTKLEIIENAKNDVENSQEEIEREETFSKEEQIDEKEENKEEVTEPIEPESSEEIQDNTEFVKPEVTAEEFKAEVYSAKSRLHIKDPAGRIIEAPTFEIYKDGKIYLRRIFKASGEIQITGLVPDTEYEIVGKYIYLNEENKKIENTFFKGTIKTKGYEALGAITLSKEEGEIFSNKIQIKNLKITSDINAEEVKGINQVEIETGEIKTVIKNDKVNELLQGKEVTIESSEGLKSNAKVGYKIRFYDKNGKELKVENNEGKSKTSKQKPTVRVAIKEQDIVSVTLGLRLTNKDKVKLENYKYVVTKPNGEIVKEERLSENEREIKLEDLDQNQYYKITVYAAFNLNDNKGIKEKEEIGNLVFATKPIATLGSLEMIIENKELTSKNAKISYKIDEDKTDKRLIQILNELTIKIVETPQDSEGNVNKEENNDEAGSKEREDKKVVYTNTLTKEEIEKLKLGETKELNYEQLKSNTTYKIEITGNIELGNTKEEVPVTYTYNKFTTLKIPAKVEIKNQFVTGNLIDLDVKVEDKDNSVLNNKVRVELRDEKSNLIDLQEIETNKEYVRKTYEKLEENKTYTLNFYADQYNEGSTDETYKINYLIKEIEIVTEPGISGKIGLTELSRKATGKNLVDVNSKVKWYSDGFNYSIYGKEYNKEENSLRLYAGNSGQSQTYFYDLSEYIGNEITISFEGKIEGQLDTVRLVNGDIGRYIEIKDNFSNEYISYKKTLIVQESGYVGFYIKSKSTIHDANFYVKSLQIELGSQKTSYEDYKYKLTSSFNVNLIDKRNEIDSNSYCIKLYENDELIKEERYEELIEDNIIIDSKKDYQVNENKNYKIELTVKVKNREYILNFLEFNTNNSEEIKGIYSIEDYLKIQPEGKYIVLNNLDTTEISNKSYRLEFIGEIDFNGKSVLHELQISNSYLFKTIGKRGTIKNIIINLKLPNKGIYTYDKGALFDNNYGTIQNIKLNLIESYNVENRDLNLLGGVNFGLIENFVINIQKKLYGSRNINIGVEENFGKIKNGYIYGEGIELTSIYKEGQNKAVAGLTRSNKGTIKNVYTNFSITNKTEEEIKNYAGNIAVYNYGNIQNIYSTQLGDLLYGPSIGIKHSGKIQNAYYFANKPLLDVSEIFTSRLALHDTNFQLQVLNEENKFEIYNTVEKGYFPHIVMPECMPSQDYIKLPEVTDKDLIDILSTNIIELNNDSAKVEVIVNNIAGEDIQNIKIKNMSTKILSQEYKNGKTKLIVLLDKPVVYTSNYSIQSITSKGAYNIPYTRNYADNERNIKIDFYREIYSLEDWKQISKLPNENYKLMESLDCKNSGNEISIKSFKGKIDGNGKEIKNYNSNLGLFENLAGEIKNIFITNVDLKVDGRNNYISLIGTGNNAILNNIHIRDVKITINNKVNNLCIGGIGANISNSNITNCSVSGINIESDKEIKKMYIGGIVGKGSYNILENNYVQNIEITITNADELKLGGIIGEEATDISIIKNCYAIGNINIEKGNVGGIAGESGARIENTFSMVDINSMSDNAGGIVGYDKTNRENMSLVSNNFVIGNVYSSKESEQVGRIVGKSIKDNFNNYVYEYQKLDGEYPKKLKEVIRKKELKEKNIYVEKLNWKDAYNYDEYEIGRLPKIINTLTNEILPNQNTYYLKSEEKFVISNIETAKINSNTVQCRLDIVNPKQYEIVDVKIENMNVKVQNIKIENNKTYINLTAEAYKFYDNYKISKIIYRNENKQEEENFEKLVPLLLYKEIYTYDDWQDIEGEYQNYKLMNDVDFNGKENIKTNISIGRLESDGDKHSLKNMRIYDDCLISDIQINIKNIVFENITIEKDKDAQGEDLGIILYNYGLINNVEFKNIRITAPKYYEVGCIANNNGNEISDVDMEDIEIEAKGTIGGLSGVLNLNILKNITGNNIRINATQGNAGGFFGISINDLSTKQREIDNIRAQRLKIYGKNFVGGIVGYGTCLRNVMVTDSYIEGAEFVGGLAGNHSYFANSENNTIKNSTIKGNGKYIGGIAGNYGGGSKNAVENCEIFATANSSYIGGAFGAGINGINRTIVYNTTIDSDGSYIGGIVGIAQDVTIDTVSGTNIEIKGMSNIGGISGTKCSNSTIRNSYNNTNIIAEGYNIGGIVGDYDNKFTSSTNINNLYNNGVFGARLKGKSNVGGIIGKAEKELYIGENAVLQQNYVQAELMSEDISKISLGIGNIQSQNTFLKNTYYYKYSKINGKNPNNQNEVFIPAENYLLEEELQRRETYYKEKLKWPINNWNLDPVDNNIYPILYGISSTAQTGIPLPKDEEHIIEENLNEENISAHNIAEENLETVELQYTFNYKGKIIKTYETYSEIIAEDGSKVVRKDVRLYVKDGKLYALPVSLNFVSNALKLVANNFVIDSYNGKEYETVLGSDGKIYDLKEAIKYPENFVNNEIANIGNNLDKKDFTENLSDKDMSKGDFSQKESENEHEIEVTYKNGDKVRFNYQTGEIISSIDEKSENKGIFEYIKEKTTEIRKSLSRDSNNKDMQNKYLDSQVLKNKLEQMPVEYALKEQSNNTNKIEDIKNGENDKANNSLKETRYISIYNAEKNDYYIYQEEELLDTTKQEVVSENDKIEANNLKEYYASEGKSRNKNMGILWITLSIVGVVIILFAIKKRD